MEREVSEWAGSIFRKIKPVTTGTSYFPERFGLVDGEKPNQRRDLGTSAGKTGLPGSCGGDW